VRKAQAVFALQVLLGTLGFAAVGLGVIVGVGHLSFGLPPTTALLEACRRLLPDLGVGSAAVLALGGLSVAVLARTVTSGIRRLRASRAVVRALEPFERRHVGGATVQVFSHASVLAFCAGLLKPRIYVSTGTIGALDASELEAVIAHEQHHACKRDPLRVFVAGVVSDGLFFAPALRRLADRYAALAELAADRAAVRIHRDDPGPLASALLAFESADPAVVGIAPERVDHLLGDAPRWNLPVALGAWGLMMIGGVAALAVLVEAAAQAPVNVPLLLAQSCMVVLVAVPVLIVAGGMVSRRRLASRAS
jgi:Zn-dependent protease with chaperone function